MLNLTPHPVILRLARDSGDGTYDLTLPPAPGRPPARVAVSRNEPGCVIVTRAGAHHPVPRRTETTGAIEGWTPADGPAIVSRMVLGAASASEAMLLYAPDTGAGAIRDEAGRIVAVTGFICREGT